MLMYVINGSHDNFALLEDLWVRKSMIPETLACKAEWRVMVSGLVLGGSPEEIDNEVKLFLITP